MIGNCDSSAAERRTRDQKVPAGAAGEFSSPESTFCADPYFGIRSTPVLPHYHAQDPSHSAKSAGGRLQLKQTYPTYVSLHELTL